MGNAYGFCKCLASHKRHESVIGSEARQSPACIAPNQCIYAMSKQRNGATRACGASTHGIAAFAALIRNDGLGIVSLLTKDLKASLQSAAIPCILPFRRTNLIFFLYLACLSVSRCEIIKKIFYEHLLQSFTILVIYYLSGKNSVLFNNEELKLNL